MKTYTVTATATYFVQANSDHEANDIVSEALLGNDNHDILGSGEVDLTSIIVRQGTHHTIQHGEDIGGCHSELNNNPNN